MHSFHFTRAAALAALALTTTAAGVAHANPLKLDVLFVIDNSGSMEEEQEALIANFPGFMATLDAVMGGLPDLHVGVVSSSVGMPYPITNCGAGDDGRLQHREACTSVTGAYLSNEIAADGVTRMTNYTGTLEDGFACMAALGTGGCGFEQHLEAMQLGLSNTVGNAGFLRADAYLAVIILADEDDCSAADPAVFNPDLEQSSLVGPLGPLTSFRCMEFGVRCDGAVLGRSAASYQDCVPRTDSYLRDPQAYVDFLKSLKADPDRIIVSVIAGSPTPVVVGYVPETPNPMVQPSCTSASGSAFPAIRLQGFIDGFPGRATFTSICDADLSPALIQVADALGGAMIGPDAGPGAPDAGGGGAIDGDEAQGCGCRAGGRGRHGMAGGWAALLLLGAALLIVTGRTSS